MDSRHISSAFDEDLKRLDDLIARMGNLTLTQFVAVIDGMSQSDVDLEPIVERDRDLDALEMKIYDKTVEIIAIRSPQAEDLRHIIIAPKIASYMERIGDYACNIVKRRRRIIESGDSVEKLSIVDDITRIARDMLIDVLDALNRRDADKAKQVWERDIELDRLHGDIYHDIYNDMVGHGTNQVSINALFIAKNIERIGDFCTSIAEQVYFVAHGVMLDVERPKADITSD